MKRSVAEKGAHVIAD